MSVRAVARLKERFGARILSASANRGDDEVLVDAKDWREVAAFAKNDPKLTMAQFVDLTAVDYPEREPDLPRFDVVLLVRSVQTKARVRLRTRVGDRQSLASLVEVWAGANWAEREVMDMFGIAFEGHPDPRRILMYEEFEGHPLRKDYPIERAQPLVPYRDAPGIEKLPPFGPDEGQPFGRIDWTQRLAGRDEQVSPAIGLQVGQRRTLSDSEAVDDTPAQRVPPTAGLPPTVGLRARGLAASGDAPSPQTGSADASSTKG